MAQQSILFIDDEIIWHRLIKQLLGGAGYKVLTAATCAEGIKLAALHKPDCIVLDFHLTDGDAVSVCSAIRANENIKNTPIIIFSSDPEAEQAACTECQAAEFVLKGNCAIANLPAAIENILRPSFTVQSDR
jgi:CheY-like chemotaxis protein